MSLQLWLPLNGDLTNNGLLENEIIPNNLSYDNSGKIGKCGRFGYGKHIDLGTVSIGKEFSICGWFNIITHNTAWATCVQLYNSDTTLISFGTLYTTTQNYASFNVQKNGTFIFDKYNFPFTLNQWSHFCVTVKDKKVVMYVNGQISYQGDMTDTPLYGEYKLRVGNRFIGSYYPDFKLNDFRVYDHCLSPKEVKEISKGLMLHYPLDNCGFGCPNERDELYSQLGMDENIEYDTSGYGNNGTKVGTLDYESDTPRHSCSSYFNGTDAYIQIPEMTLDFNSVTFSVWYKPSGNVEWGRIFDFGVGINGRGTTFLIDQNQQKMELCIQGMYPDGTNIQSSDDVFYPIVANTWYYVACSIEGTICKWYMDGKLVMTKTLTQNIGVVTFINNFLAKSNWTVNPLNRCNISDFRIYSTCLSDSDIQELYNKPISIDNQGVMFATEVNEETTNSVKFGKNGIVDIESINPNENTSNKFKIYKNYIECSDIIEN